MGPYLLCLPLPLLPYQVRLPIFLDTGSQPSDIMASYSEVRWCPKADMYPKVWAGPYNIIKIVSVYIHKWPSPHINTLAQP